MDRDIRRITLDTLGALVDGRAGRQFEAAIEAVIDAVIDEEAQRADGMAKGKVVVTITVEGTSRDDGGRVSLAVEVATTPPKLRASGSGLIDLGGGKFGVDLTETQTKLFDSPRVVGKE